MNVDGVIFHRFKVLVRKFGLNLFGTVYKLSALLLAWMSFNLMSCFLVKRTIYDGFYPSERIKCYSTRRKINVFNFSIFRK